MDSLKIMYTSINLIIVYFSLSCAQEISTYTISRLANSQRILQNDQEQLSVRNKYECVKKCSSHFLCVAIGYRQEVEDDGYSTCVLVLEKLTTVYEADQALAFDIYRTKGNFF